MKELDIRINRLFKKYIVSRPNGNCQVLFALTKLDKLVEEIMQEIAPPPQNKPTQRKMTPDQYERLMTRLGWILFWLMLISIVS